MNIKRGPRSGRDGVSVPLRNGDMGSSPDT
jgi:hypothetical protein